MMPNVPVTFTLDRYRETNVDYGEELAYWYLRLNGFFPITNFVVHRTEKTQHRSDIDVLAIRPAHVYEHVGGHGADWDAYLKEQLPFDRMLGILCEVKTGAFEKDKMFRAEYVRYALPRLGLVPEAECDKLAAELSAGASAPTVATWPSSWCPRSHRKAHT
jgi:hypothetical protein